MYLDDLKLNTEIELPNVTISKERMLEFAQIYDPLPLHCDEEYAKNTRFGQLVAPGVMTFMTVWAEVVKLTFSVMSLSRASPRKSSGSSPFSREIP